MEKLETKQPSHLVDGPIDGVELRPLTTGHDERGWLTELFRSDQLPAEQHPVMAYVSCTLPGIVRGPHEHRQQTDYFAFLGPGDFTLYLWDIRVGSSTWGHRMKIVVGQSNPQVVIIPPGIVHGYRNTSHVDGWVFNAANRLYAGEHRREPVDEIRYENQDNHPYRMD